MSCAVMALDLETNRVVCLKIIESDRHRVEQSLDGTTPLGASALPSPATYGIRTF